MQYNTSGSMFLPVKNAMLIIRIEFWFYISTPCFEIGCNIIHSNLSVGKLLQDRVFCKAEVWLESVAPS